MCPARWRAQVGARRAGHIKSAEDVGVELADAVVLADFLQRTEQVIAGVVTTTSRRPNSGDRGV